MSTEVTLPDMVAGSYLNILKALVEAGVEQPRPGLAETPRRAAEYFLHMMSGYLVKDEELPALLKSFTDGAEGCDEMVALANIPTFSMCEHHLAPIFGVTHIGYIPNEKIIGLSKMPRLVDVFARRLQVQERLTVQIADALWNTLKPKGVGVVIRARHLCMEARGVERVGIDTRTSALRGVMKDEGARGEFLQFVASGDKRSML
jgi:GTP cyclohydrolase I